MTNISLIYHKCEQHCINLIDSLNKWLDDIFFSAPFTQTIHGILNVIFIFGWLFFFGEFITYHGHNFLPTLIYGSLPIKCDSNVYLFLLVDVIMIIGYFAIAYWAYKSFFFNQSGYKEKIALITISVFVILVYFFFLHRVDRNLTAIIPQLPLQYETFWAWEK